MTPAATAAAPANRAVIHTPSGRIFNFGAGPSCLPEPILRQIQEDVWNYRGTGIGILEISHRGPEYDAIVAEVDHDLREVGGIPPEYKILFMTGGATSQNYIVPANLLPPGGAADYLVTGYWAQASFRDAAQYASCHNTAATIHAAYDGQGDKFASLPDDGQIRYSARPSYVHMTTNNTIYGTQWHRLPKVPDDAFLVCDACSDFFWAPTDVTKYGLIYGGAQKNLGTTGATFVVVRDDLVAQANKNIPRMLQYGVFAREESRPNTPPAFAVYTVGLMAKWIRSQGGLATMEKRNREKAQLVYDALDRHAGFYIPHARRQDRSFMNITFRCKGGEAMDNRFLADAKASGLDVLKGHRATGGMRASTYNAMPREGCVALAQFIDEFAKKNG